MLKQFIFSLLVAAAGLGFIRPAAAMEILVPAYFYPVPGSPWNDLTLAAPRVPIVAIMNPGNGPGTSADNSYRQAVNALRNAGGRVIGYVYSSYTRRPLAEVKADVNLYYSLYGVDGIFVDEMDNTTNAASYAYYGELYQFIKARSANALVIGNPGINTQEEYLTRLCADTLVTFEHSEGYEANAPDAWTTNHPARRFAHLLYGMASAGAMTNDVQLAASRNAGFIFVTADVLPNPWDTLPGYWAAEVGLVEQLNRARLAIARSPGGGVRVDITGAPGVRYVSEVSSNLAQWSPLATNRTDTGAFSVTNDPGQSKARFFRARQ